jgi:hypothetical protein
VISVVDSELRSRASVTEVLDLPASCLLAMVISPTAKQPNYAIESEVSVSAQAEADAHDYSLKRILFAIDADSRTVLFQQGIGFGGDVYDLIAALAQEFEADLNAGTFRDQHRYVRAEALAKRLKITQQSLRRRISRARRNIEQTFLRKMELVLDAEDVVQNQSWQGYRLNPYLLLVKPAQLRDRPPPGSQVGSPSVTNHGVVG